VTGDVPAWLLFLFGLLGLIGTGYGLAERRRRQGAERTATLDAARQTEAATVAEAQRVRDAEVKAAEATAAEDMRRPLLDWTNKERKP
jgi:hypothetical protein